MTDPANSLQSFQEELLLGTVRPTPTRLDPDLFLYRDSPLGERSRMTYVRLEGSTVTALVMFVPEEYINGIPCAGIGYAVPQGYRGQGRAKEIIRAGIADMQYGLSLQGIPTFYVEAIVGADNSASRRVAEQLISTTPDSMTDDLSGLPAFRYIRMIEKAGSG
jgi:RimJ/RimL family protein N-acetyltransferase